MKVIGLMSGTSADGIDSALVEIAGIGPQTTVRLLNFVTVPYPRALQRHVLHVCREGSAAEICRLNATLGERFANAALRVIASSDLTPLDIHLIGSHGQTVHHHPYFRERSTLQIGEPSVIAERTGITTVADFRPRDMAGGGEGAPLTPSTHRLLFQHPTRSRLIVNLGGICNVTYLPAQGHPDQMAAFDVGPGNMMINGIVTHLSNGKASRDTGGSMASRGIVNEALLQRLLSHRFLRRRPPKSTGREEFGDHFTHTVVSEAKRQKLRDTDLLASVTQFTAQAVAESRRFLPGPIHDVILTGGGTRNRALVQAFHRALTPAAVTTAESFGWNSRAIEATAFAVLAYQTIHGEANNLPAVTGARHHVVMGKIIPGRSFRCSVR